MLSNKSGILQVIKIERSAYLLATVSLIYLSSFIVNIMLPLSWYANLFIGLILLISYILFLVRSDWIRLANKSDKIPEYLNPISLINYNAAGQWQLVRTDGKSKEAILLGASTSSHYLVVLKFLLPNSHWLLRKVSIIIAKDSLDKHSFRRLRVTLRFLKDIK